jgi:hypothetical protein
MWARFLLAAIVAAGAIAFIVIRVERAGPEGSSSEAAAEAEANRLADIAVTEDEAPHSAAISSGSATAMLEQSIASDVRARISSRQLSGPLDGVSCRETSDAHAGRTPYSCTARSAQVSYPFVAVVDMQRRQLTWCKVDPPATAGAGPEVLISSRCRR